MTKAFDQAVEAAARLPKEEQDALAERMKAWLERMHRESPFHGRREELKAGVREFRDGFVFRHDQSIGRTEAFAQAAEAAASLPEGEQDKLAAEIMDKVWDARAARRKAFLERIKREGGPLDGRSEEFLRHVREFREGFVFKHDREGDDA